MSQSMVHKISAAIQQYELDKPPSRRMLNSSIIIDQAYSTRERKVLRKLDRRLLPVLSLFFLITMLNRNNIAYANTHGMPELIKLKGLEYRNCLMIFFISYCAAQVPSNIMCLKTTPAFWLPTLMCTWGVVMTCMGLIVDYKGLFWSRFFLGIFEAGMTPGINMYLTMWYRRSEIQVRMAVVFAVGTAVDALGGLLALCIIKMNNVGGMEGWRWIFVLEGCLSVVLGTLAYMFLTNSPSTAKFLKDDEKELVITRVKMDENWPTDQYSIAEYVAEEKKQKTWRGVKNAVSDWQTYSHAFIFLCIQVSCYAITMNLPLLIERMKYEGTTAELLTLPIYFAACIGSILFAVVSDKVGLRAPILIFCFIMTLAGFILIVVSRVRDTRHSVAFSGLFVAALGAFGAIPCSIAWLAGNTLCTNKRNISLALQIGIGNLGGVIVSYLYDRTLGEGVLVFLVAGIVVCVFNVAMYRRINARHNFRLFCVDDTDRRYMSQTSISELVALGDRNPYFEYTY